jgi:hypothetical protein
MSRRTLSVVVAAIVLAGCASTPTGPSVMVLPGSGKTFDQFRADDARCRQLAAADVETTKGGAVSTQQRFDVAYMQCMYAAGNQIPMSGRGAPPTAAMPSAAPPPPAGTPPPPPPSGPSR